MDAKEKAIDELPFGEVKIYDCNQLSTNLDSHRSFSPRVCSDWETNDYEPIEVGGLLINIDKSYEEDNERYAFVLTFQGILSHRDIRITSKNDTLPYEIEKYYRFDLGNECFLMDSTTSSGNFADPELTSLKRMELCE